MSKAEQKQEMVVHASAQGGALTVGQMSIDDVLQSVAIIKTIQEKVMKKDVHFGVIPGTKKPTLLLPGAQVLALTFRMRPKYTLREIALDGLHRENQVDCELVTAGGEYIGQGLGCCSTMESKYRFRTQETYTLTDFEVPPTYWRLKDKREQQKMLRTVCEVHNRHFGTKKIGGVWRIIELGGETEQIEHPNPADFWNTVLKIAKKRAYVDAILTATAASDVFTQDLEDMQDNAVAATEASGRNWEEGGGEEGGGKEAGEGEQQEASTSADKTGKGSRKKTEKETKPDDGQQELQPTNPNPAPAGVSEEIANAWPASREKPKSWHDNYVHRKSSLGTRKLEELSLAELRGIKEKFVDDKRFWKSPSAEDLLLKLHILEAIGERMKEPGAEDTTTQEEPVTAEETHALEAAEKLAEKIAAAGLEEGEYFLKLAELNQVPDGKTWTSIDEVDEPEWLDFANHTFEGFLKLAGLVERKKSGKTQADLTKEATQAPAEPVTTEKPAETTPETPPAPALGASPSPVQGDSAPSKPAEPSKARQSKKSAPKKKAAKATKKTATRKK